MKKENKKKNVSLEDKINNLTNTVDNLAISVAKGFEHLENKMDTKFNEVDKRFDGVDKSLEDIEYRLGKIESNHERRLDILEDKMAIVKTFFEKNPKLKVKFN
jgi:hypothetical protein